MDKAPVQEGDILAGKYKIERMLAKGGMGVVVAAMHEGLDQRVALKFLLPEGASNTEAVGRFLREARAAVRLRSEHVARVLDVGTLDTGSPYIVMEYLEGRDLQTLLSERTRLPAHTAVSYVLQACEAIAEAHAHGIVHRDLKPGNLFLTRRNDGTACIKVLDFGISKMPSAQLEAGMTKTSTVMGTPYYISPEQLRSSKNADGRSDIWALGMILYELLTGSVAFPRDTLPELCTAIIYEPVPDFSTHGVDVAPQLVQVVMRCLEKAPEQRYQTLAELGSALAAFVTDGDASAERISRILEPKERTSGTSQPPPGAPSASTIQPLVEEPPTSIPITVASVAGAGPRGEDALDREQESFGETALSAQLASPQWSRSARLVLAAVVVSTAVACWMIGKTLAPQAAAAPSHSALPIAPPTPVEVRPPTTQPAETAPSVVVERAAEPAVSASAKRAPSVRSGGTAARVAGDEFGLRK